MSTLLKAQSWGDDPSPLSSKILCCRFMHSLLPWDIFLWQHQITLLQYLSAYHKVNFLLFIVKPWPIKIHDRGKLLLMSSCLISWVDGKEGSRLLWIFKQYCEFIFFCIGLTIVAQKTKLFFEIDLAWFDLIRNFHFKMWLSCIYRSCIFIIEPIFMVILSLLTWAQVSMFHHPFLLHPSWTTVIFLLW